MKYKYSDITKLLHDAVGKISAKSLFIKCKEMGMEEIEYQDFGNDSTLPNFDKGFRFEILTENKGRCILEILEKDEDILQAGIQVFFKSSIFSPKINKTYDQIVEILKNYYKPEQEINSPSTELLNFSDNNTLCYVYKTKINGEDLLTFRIGNVKFWK